ncbi:CHAD domain-containing protein [Nocardioides sp. YIM 152588]|uniref:CHAD domain-containing protein n=1 Tax=Nocardioides sp. YIM 152588 TaxID=3158259 RepID=UPI0032E408AC
MAPAVTTGEMVSAVIADLTGRIDQRLPAAVADEPDGVHRLRTSVRRLRTVLSEFDGQLRRRPTKELRHQLGDLGAVLGVARDLEVRADLCDAVLERVDLARLRPDLVAPLRAEHDGAHRTFAAWCDGVAARALMGTLGDWGAAPPLKRADRSAVKVARRLVLARADRTLALVPAALPSEALAATPPEALHELRKQARRLRHVAEAVTKPPAEVLGEDVAVLGAAGSAIQSTLGDHRDALLLAEYVEGVAPAAAPYASVAAEAREQACAALSALPADVERLAEARSAMG